MRLIDADKLAKEIADSINDASIQNDELSLSILRVFKKTVDDEPTIDAEPVKRAKWYAPASGEPCEWCSNCRERTRWFFDEGYCPKCGARMDGDTNA